MDKKRDSGIELLRIIAIFFVIGIHALLYGKYFEAATAYGGFVSVCAWFLRFLFRPAVNLFVIITGYFLVKEPFDLKHSYKRALSVYLVIYFYSIVLSLITLLAGKGFYTVDGETTPVFVILLKMFFPMLSQQWYFLTDYILLCLFAPFVNVTLQKITKKQYQILIGISSMVLSVWFVLAKLEPLKGIFRTYGFGSLAEGKNVFSFLYIYLLGGYIGLYGKQRKRAEYRYLFFAVLCFLINFVVAIKLDPVLKFRSAAVLYSNPMVILTAVFLLLFFKDVHFYCKPVNVLASTTLGVYAIHEFPYIRNFLWGILDFSGADFSNQGINFLRLAGVMFLVFFVCAAIELLRQGLFHMAGKIRKGE